MGARIEGAGSSTIEIEGVDAFAPAEHRVIPDRIEAGTWAAAAVATRGDVTIDERAARPPRAVPARSSPTPGADVGADRDGAAHPAASAAAGGRLRHAAVPGGRDRLPADPDGDARDGRGHEHRDRERLREPVPLRRRAAPDGRRHPHGGPPRGDPRRRAALGRSGARARHPGRRRDGDRGALSPTASPRSSDAAPPRSRVRGLRGEARERSGRGRRAGSASIRSGRR